LAYAADATIAEIWFLYLLYICESYHKCDVNDATIFQLRGTETGNFDQTKEQK